jgi:hypothetical protein
MIVGYQWRQFRSFRGVAAVAEQLWSRQWQQ